MSGVIESDAPLAGGNPYFDAAAAPQNPLLHAGGAIATRTADIGDGLGDSLEDKSFGLGDVATPGSHAPAPSGWGLPPSAPGYDWREGRPGAARPAPAETSLEDAADVFNADSTGARLSRRGAGNPTSLKPQAEVWPGDFDTPVPLGPDLSRWRYTSVGGGTRVASLEGGLPSSTKHYTRVGDTWVPTRDPASDDFSFAAAARVAVARGGRA